MSHPDSACFVFDSHAAAEDATRTPGISDLDMKQLALVDQGYHSEKVPMGFCTMGDRIQA